MNYKKTQKNSCLKDGLHQYACCHSVFLKPRATLSVLTGWRNAAPGLALSGLASSCVAQNKPPPYMLMTISKVIAIGLYNVIHVQSVEYILYLIKILWYFDICKKQRQIKTRQNTERGGNQIRWRWVMEFDQIGDEYQFIFCSPVHIDTVILVWSGLNTRLVYGTSIFTCHAVRKLGTLHLAYVLGSMYTDFIAVCFVILGYKFIYPYRRKLFCRHNLDINKIWPVLLKKRGCVHIPRNFVEELDITPL